MPCSRAVQPFEQFLIERLVVRVKTVFQKVPLHVLHRVLNLALALRVAFPAEKNTQPTGLTELFKRMGVGNVPRVFADTDNAVLIEDQFPRHPAKEGKAATRDTHQVL